MFQSLIENFEISSEFVKVKLFLMEDVLLRKLEVTDILINFLNSHGDSLL